MALDVASYNYAFGKLLPLYDPQSAIELPVNIAPSKTLAKGQVLGQITSAANDVQTLAQTGTPTGGSVIITVTHPLTGAAYDVTLAFNSTPSQTQTAIRAALGGTFVAVTGDDWADGNQVVTFSGIAAGMAVPLIVVKTNSLTGGTSPAVAVTHTTQGRSANTYDVYADAGSGGLDTARAILPYDIATDANGKVYYGTEAGLGQAHDYISVYFKGIFSTAELTGLTAAAVADLGRLMSGSTTAGVLSMA